MPTKTAYILHGWTSSPDTRSKWQPLLSQLNSRGIETHFLAIPGLDTDLEKPWNLSDYRQWLHSVVDDDGPFVLIGHSFGGQLAAYYTAHYDQLVERLVLIDSAGIRDKSLLISIKRALFQGLAKVGKLCPDECVIRNKLRWLLYKLAREKDYYQTSGPLRQTMANVITAEIIQDLKKIKTQTLIIWGRNDRTTLPKLAKKFEQSLVNSRLVWIDQASHSPQYTHPQEVANHILAFLSAGKVQNSSLSKTKVC